MTHVPFNFWQSCQIEYSHKKAKLCTLVNKTDLNWHKNQKICCYDLILSEDHKVIKVEHECVFWTGAGSGFAGSSWTRQKPDPYPAPVQKTWSWIRSGSTLNYPFLKASIEISLTALDRRTRNKPIQDWGDAEAPLAKALCSNWEIMRTRMD